MIGLVFNSPEKPSSQSRSWWQEAQQLPRTLWKSLYRYQELSRLRMQKKIEEPTARKEQPDWERRWKRRLEEQAPPARVDMVQSERAIEPDSIDDLR